RGANSPVPLLPSWEKGLGDEGKTSSQSRFFLKLTRMGSAVPLHFAKMQNSTSPQTRFSFKVWLTKFNFGIKGLNIFIVGWHKKQW
ncbi:hypothetical protein, partial [Nostoc commune]|uniref:hypothetical protein n=1 Tax=Nostoc commune TaxID=1178 RepID=UPI001E38608E